MIATPPPASLSNLGGPDFLVLFLGLAFSGFVIGSVVLLIRHLTRKNTSAHPTATPEERLQKLDALRSDGTITDSEYQEHRGRILSEI